MALFWPTVQRRFDERDASPIAGVGTITFYKGGVLNQLKTCFASRVFLQLYTDP